MSDARFEELLGNFEQAVIDFHAVKDYRTEEIRTKTCRVARAALLAYFEERMAGIRVTANQDDAGYWIADQNDTQPENATLILDEVPR
jgi:hypothetical protein